MTNHPRVLVQTVVQLPPESAADLTSVKAALKSAIQVGLNAQVLSIEAYPLAAEAPLPPAASTIPASEPSDKDQVIEKYLHSGMTVEIMRCAGRGQPSYFAVVTNPAAKYPSGAVIDADSYAQVKEAAEERAQRKSELWQKRLNRLAQ